MWGKRDREDDGREKRDGGAGKESTGRGHQLWRGGGKEKETNEIA